METGFAIYETQFGYIQMAYEGSQLISLKMLPTGNNATAGTRTPLTNQVYKELWEYWAGERKNFDFPYELRGTPFQQKVWEALRNIPYGETRSYKQIATAIGQPQASRAVGMANNRNPMIIVVPCHRVVGAKGQLIGYAGGIAMKQALLELEERYFS